jgi:hypothetical protein
MTMMTVLQLSKCVDLYTAVAGLLIVGTESPMKGVQCYIIQKSICTIFNISTLWRCNGGPCKTALSQGCNPVPALPLHNSHVLCSSITHCLATTCTWYQSHQEYMEYSEENHTRKQVHTPSKETAMLSGPSCKILGMKLLHLVSESAETNMIHGCSSGIV